MQFTAFPGPELVNQEKFSQKNEICDLEIAIFISVKLFVFLVDSKPKSNLSVWIPDDRWFTDSS